MPLIISAPRLTLRLLENATDCLIEGCERFARQLTERDLRFSLLQISQAFELFLKARLAKEHRLLVFVDPGKTGGDARTVDARTAAERLRAAGVPLDGIPELEPLLRLRNRLQHFELNELAEVVTKQVGLAIKFLEPFIEKELGIRLQDQLSDDVYFVARKAGLEYEAALELALRKRDDDLAALPQGVRDGTLILRCDFCGQPAILYPNPKAIPPHHVRCYFCDERHAVTKCSRCQRYTVEGDPCDFCSSS
jgi:hypothetical protein